ncbi:MAG: histidinol phosphate phosphatase domain-containing protein [Desulfuromonadaceae bacterium]|nr:histidinol phosphate phosphatase domain-containing protein [Desulfuromonadaceae bacterium]
MIDLHTHSIFSDGELIPSELVRRASVAGYRAIAITDHGDFSNLDLIIPRLLKATKGMRESFGIEVLAGIEVTYLPPSLMAQAVAEARRLGAQIVVCHGETLSEPVAPGTNRAAIMAGVDILGHPGLITPEEVRMAREKGVHLEITTRKGHSLANGHVAKLAVEIGAKLVIDTDSHAPDDLTPWEKAERIARGAGLSTEQIAAARANSQRLVEKVTGRALAGGS